MTTFDKNWWSKILQLNEISNAEVIDHAVTGFKLVRDPRAFGNSYRTKTGKATIDLAKRIHTWIKEKFPNNNIRIRFEKVHGTINLNESILHESPPIEFEKDDYEDYVNQNRDRIEKAATDFNLPIQDMMLAFIGGNEVVLSDDIWSKLENSKSYKVKSLDDAIQAALKAGIDPKPYIDFIKDGKELPLPMVLCYAQDKYYLVGGDLILSLYKALGSIPVVLQGTLNLQTRSQHEPLEEEAGQSIKDKHADIVKYFVKFAVKELDLKQLPTKITLSYNTDDAKNQHSFGHFDPSNDKIWVYVKDRNTADFLRTLAHELIHRKQAEDGRLEPGDGATGSDIENEANAQAGVLLRKFGKENEDIYGTLSESLLNEYNFGLDQAFEWSYKGGPDSKYTFTTGQIKYEVVFKSTPESEGLYERTYKPVGSIANTKTGEGKPFPVIATVTAITLDFMKRNNDWHTIMIHPISANRYRAVIQFLHENIPTDKYNIEEIEGIINITRKLNEAFINDPGDSKYKFKIGDKVADFDGDLVTIVDRRPNFQEVERNPISIWYINTPPTDTNKPFYLIKQLNKDKDIELSWQEEKYLSEDINEAFINIPGANVEQKLENFIDENFSEFSQLDDSEVIYYDINVIAEEIGTNKNDILEYLKPSYQFKHRGIYLYWVARYNQIWIENFDINEAFINPPARSRDQYAELIEKKIEITWEDNITTRHIETYEITMINPEEGIIIAVDINNKHNKYTIPIGMDALNQLVDTGMWINPNETGIRKIKII